MELIFTKEKSYLEKWDAFVAANPFGNHLQLSQWLQSYKSYGFDFEICVLQEQGKIVWGYGAVIAKFSFFKFYIVPNGPLVSDLLSEDFFQQITSAIHQRAKFHKSCYCQFNLPVSGQAGVNALLISSCETPFKPGSLFKYVYSSEGLNWLDLSKYGCDEEILNDFKSSVRRDIRSSERKGQTIKYLETEVEIREAYAICEENANRAGYSLRSWPDFKETILNLTTSGCAKFIAAQKDNEMKGAVFLVKSGNYYSYILGGVKRETPDLLTGHLLQWEAIKMSLREDCPGYNISLGGSVGVKSFKSGFNVSPIIDENARYYFIAKPFVFKLFLFFEKKIKPHKKTISKFLSKF